ncbi:glycosyltransferase family 4 protein [Thermococcus sp. PK]|uniref:glycosyltransferase family 4 protein n=1 Tax=Thermococcus sp. PK TaxID=913025 RepID=UPI0005B29759|nr:glycosyltransferase family 4 protein [Thermococcus sp. PK]
MRVANASTSRSLLVLTNSYPDFEGKSYGGSFVKGQIDELKNYFNEVYVISPQPLGKNRFLRDYSYDNVHIYYPRFFHAPIEFFRKKLGENFYKAALRVINQKGLDFDLIHAHFTWPSGYAGVKLSKEFEVPVVVTIHENREWFLEEYNSKNEKIYWTWRNANALIRVNRKDVPLLREFNPNVYSIPNGFNPNRLFVMPKDKAREKLGIPLEKKVLFSLGNLIERKGFQYLIEAMKTIVKYRDDTICFIGGRGPLKKKLQKQVEKYNLENYVKLLGAIPDEKLALWMNAADLFVLSSLSESFGLVVLEALAVGTPAVATINGGSEEVITSEDYGLLCEPGNVDDLAEKILIALNKEWNREKIRKYAEQFTWRNIVKQILEVYRGVW